MQCLVIYFAPNFSTVPPINLFTKLRLNYDVTVMLEASQDVLAIPSYAIIVQTKRAAHPLFFSLISLSTPRPK